MAALICRRFSTGKPQVSDIVMDPTSGRHTAFVGFRCSSHSALASYSIAVSLTTGAISPAHREQIHSEELLGILDRRGNFVARIPDHAERGRNTRQRGLAPCHS
jgi:hypothetical protein